MSPDRNIACRHYRGDRPCRWNKADGSQCPSCAHAEPIGLRVLIVKLDAIGDVLRSTVILPKLKSAHPDSHITWLTRAASAPLLSGNPHVDEVWLLDDAGTQARLAVQEWDLVINLDNAFTSSALAAQARAPRKIGYVLSPQGAITPTNEAAEAWITLASFDQRKKANTRSYQEHMYAICGFHEPIERPVLVLEEKRRAAARAAVREGWIQPGEVLVGLNTGAGGRWPLKMMSEARQVELVHRLLEDPGRKILLLGGPGEGERNERLAAALVSERVRDAGCEHSLLDFAARVDQCDALICGDTLALHIATARGVPTVVVFCPTSIAEIHAYDGLLAKLRPDDCACFCGYNRDCPWGKDCINTISLPAIALELDKQLGKAR